MGSNVLLIGGTWMLFPTGLEYPFDWMALPP